jgi:hypothetical protein
VKWPLKRDLWKDSEKDIRLTWHRIDNVDKLRPGKQQTVTFLTWQFNVRDHNDDT